MMTVQTKNTVSPIFIVSGGKGIAGHTMVHSLLIQYPNNNVPVSVIPDIQSPEKITEVVKHAKSLNAMIVHSMVNSELRKLLLECCHKEDVKEIDFMGPLADYLENELGLVSISIPGLYRRINAQYFDRIEAIEYTMNHDDGLDTNHLKSAEIVLTGVSRAGKTPLSVYMSMFGWKVANVPLIINIDPPIQLFEVDPRRVFGLRISPEQLIPLRTQRMKHQRMFGNNSYIDEDEVQAEVRFANRIFERGGFTVINVANKPIETTANEIIGMISERFAYDIQKIKNVDP
jgi:[pyruvate, water dikinase]-phosphate phosphotransferase / [pyruvate, water dikinase] kinase